MMARRPRAPVFLDIACFAIACRASTVISKFTCKPNSRTTNLSHAVRIITRQSNRTSAANMISVQLEIMLLPVSISILLFLYLYQRKIIDSADRFELHLSCIVNHAPLPAPACPTPSLPPLPPSHSAPSPHLIHVEQRLVLRYERVPRPRQNLHQHRLAERLERHDDREAADELRDHAEVDHVARLHLPEQGVALRRLCDGVVVGGLGGALLARLRRRAPTLQLRQRRPEPEVLRGNFFFVHFYPIITGEIGWKIVS